MSNDKHSWLTIYFNVIRNETSVMYLNIFKNIFVINSNYKVAYIFKIIIIFKIRLNKTLQSNIIKTIHHNSSNNKSISEQMSFEQVSGLSYILLLFWLEYDITEVWQHWQTLLILWRGTVTLIWQNDQLVYS